MLGCARKGILRRTKSCRDPVLCSWSLLCWFMDANHCLTWCEPAPGSLWRSLYQDKEGKESLSLLDLCILKLSRFIAALTYCSFLSTEYVLSVQCCVPCLGKRLCDSLEFLDVSNVSPAKKKTFLVFCNGAFV